MENRWNIAMQRKRFASKSQRQSTNMSNRTCNKNQDSSGVKCVVLGRGTWEQDAADDESEDSWPCPVAANMLPSTSNNNNNPDDGFGPDFKDQVRTMKPPPQQESPDFKDQVQSVQLSSQQQGSGRTKPSAGPHLNQEEEDSTVVQHQQRQRESQASPGGDGVEEATAVPLVQGILINNEDTGGGGRLPNHQMTEKHKHMIWAIVVIGLVLIVTLSLTLTNKSGGGGEEPTNSPVANPVPPGGEDPTPSPVANPFPPPNLAAKLTASDGSAFDLFGGNVAIDGDTMVVTAAGDVNTIGGSAYVFTRSTGTTWTEQAKLMAGVEEENRFGTSVAIGGDTIVVGAFVNNVNNGTAFVYARTGTTWSEQAKLTASDGVVDDQFGRSVAIAGDTIVVGADEDDTENGTKSGSAYVFMRTGTTWTEQAKLMASDGMARENFGIRVAIAGDTIVVGAWQDNNDNGADSGAAYVFRYTGTTWTEQAKLMASDGAMDDWFGEHVAIAGDTVVVGAFGNDDNGLKSGSAYVYMRFGITWAEQAKLTADDGMAGDEFGFSVAIAGDIIVVGAWHDNSVNDNGASIENTGSAYVFARTGTTWAETEQIKLTAGDGVAGDDFGVSVAISMDTIVVGALRDDDHGTNSGSVYVYDLN